MVTEGFMGINSVAWLGMAVGAGAMAGIWLAVWTWVTDRYFVTILSLGALFVFASNIVDRYWPKDLFALMGMGFLGMTLIGLFIVTVSFYIMGIPGAVMRCLLIVRERWQSGGR